MLEWIWDRLELDSVEHEDDIKYTYLNPLYSNNALDKVAGKRSNSGISSKQINTFESCLKHSLLKNTYEAIHSLKEFIDNQQNSIQEPFNSFERISIRIMITYIIQSMEVNQ